MKVEAELPSTALHEGIPGHHLQISIGNTLPSVPRRVLSTPAAREGWALYCESLMAEMGFLDSAAERFFQAHNLLWRAIRVILDVSLHTKNMSMEDAASRLRDELAPARRRVDVDLPPDGKAVRLVGGDGEGAARR